MHRPLTLAVATLALASPLAAQFADVSIETATVFLHAPGTATFGMSGGLAWFDMDRDGDDDLVCTSSDGAHRLFRNDGGVFADVTDTSNVAQPVGSENFGVAAGDYDQDGLVDLFLTNNGPNTLLRNLGGGVFTDVTDGLGIAGDRMSTAAAWADFDLDGDLDLYVGNYLEQIQFPFHIGADNRLWVNEGTADAPAFVDRAAALGVDGSGSFGLPPAGFEPGLTGAPTSGCTLSVSTLDYDDDGDADLLIGNDFGMFVLPNMMFRNDSERGGRLVFTDVGDETGFSETLQYNMGVHGADFDLDGDWDLYLSNLGDNALLLNEGGRYFDVAASAGPLDGGSPIEPLLRTSWGTAWIDFDNDGLEDLHVANGYVPAASFIANETRSPNTLWHNLGDGAFAEVPTSVSGLADEGAGRGLAATDVDGDGTLDVYLMNNRNPAVSLPNDFSRLFRGRPHPTHHWLQVRLTGTVSNTEALGARVDAVVGTRTLRRQVRDDSVYLTSPSRLVHFGLGEHDRVDRLIVRWPSGLREEFLDVPADRRLHLVEPASAAGR